MKSQYNTDCFKSFNKEEDCYFYGLLLADGYLRKDRNIVSISLSENDCEILNKMKDWFGFAGNIFKRTTQRHESGKKSQESILTIENKAICENLKAQGFEHKKTLKEKLPKFVKNNLESERHFWRGFVDGDGHIAQRHSSILELGGSKEIIEEFSVFCSKILNKQLKNKRECVKTAGFYRISYCGKDARDLIKYLYSNCSLYLPRKQKFVEIFHKFQLKIETKVCGLPASEKYIRTQGKSYIVQVNGKYVGSKRTLEDAQFLRDSYLAVNKK